jgi:hypothetical protein
MQTLFSILITLQFLIILSHDFVDIPGWVYGSRVRATVGRNKFLAATLSTGIFPAIAAAFAVFYWNRPKPAFVYQYWLVYCAITVISAVAMWYIPYFFGPSEEHKRMYSPMYEGTRHILPARGDDPGPNVFHILLHILFATTLILALVLLLTRR